MVWYTTMYYKHYKWLSSQNIYLLFFFNKLFIYIDFIFSKLLWLSFYSVDLYTSEHPSVKSFFSKTRFYKPVTSYLVNTGANFSLINIYYRSTLETFQQFNEVTSLWKKKTNEEKLVEFKLSNLFFKLKKKFKFKKRWKSKVIKR